MLTDERRAKVKKLINKDDRERDELSKREELLARELKKKIDKYNVYYIADANKYAVWRNGADNHLAFDTLAPDGLAKFFNLTAKGDRRTFDDILRVGNRMKLKAVNTFSDCPDDVLNLMSRDRWLKPAEGDHDSIFDVLMESLSGGRESVRSHLEKVLIYKYLHPEEYRLPCITISGEGGAGKNELIEQVFATIFGKQQVAVIGMDEAFGSFNGQMFGKTIVFIDEAITEKTNVESMKRKVGNPTIQINMKYGMQGTFDNTPWYWLGGNGTNGALMLAGDLTDRRYSVITVKHSIMHWVGKHLDIPVNAKTVLPDDHACVKWYNEHRYALSDRDAVAKWLGHLIEQWGDQKRPPSALHDEDYTTVLSIQKSIFDELMEYIFLDSRFTHIEGKTLFKLYKLWWKENVPTGRAKGRNTFIEDVKRWLDRNELDIEWVKLTILTTGGGALRSGRTSGTGFIRADLPRVVTRNCEMFISVDKYGKESIVERLDFPGEKGQSTGSMSRLDGLLE